MVHSVRIVPVPFSTGIGIRSAGYCKPGSSSLAIYSWYWISIVWRHGELWLKIMELKAHLRIVWCSKQNVFPLRMSH